MVHLLCNALECGGSSDFVTSFVKNKGIPGKTVTRWGERGMTLSYDLFEIYVHQHLAN